MPTLPASVIKGKLTKPVGTSGFVKITALLPSVDSGDVPTTFVAVSLAYTEAPQSKLKGAALSTVIGIEHAFAETIPELLPSQFTVSGENVVSSLCRTKIMYELITEPPSLSVEETSQLKSTRAPLIVVVGALGVPGIEEALMFTPSESSE